MYVYIKLKNKMKRFRFYALLVAMVTFVACSDDFVPVLVTDLETDTFEFTSEGGEQSFILETNEQWSVSQVPEWITVKVTDDPVTRSESTSYEKGKKAILVAVKENPNYKDRSAELLMTLIITLAFVKNSAAKFGFKMVNKLNAKTNSAVITVTNTFMSNPNLV